MQNKPPSRPMRVVLWGTYDTGKPRVRILRQGLRLKGVEVMECHADVWGGIEDKSQVKSMSRWLRLFARALVSYPRLVWRYIRMPQHDVVMVVYPGLVDLFVLRIFSGLRRTPLAWDWFLSAYDTIVLDRRLVHPRHPVARLIYGIEWLAARLANAVFMDTAAHARRMEALFGLSAGSIGHVWVGVEREHFDPGDDKPTATASRDGTALKVLFYGQFIPLHGIPTIVAAASLLRDEPVDWLLIGRGQETSRIRSLLQRSGLPKLQWIEWVPYDELRQALANADVVLGIFGTSDKAASVIPNKVFQILAARRPLITRDSAAIRELVSHGPPAVQLVPAGDAAALAAAVMVLANRRTAPHADIGGPSLTDRFDAAAVGTQLLGILQSLIKRETSVA